MWHELEEFINYRQGRWNLNSKKKGKTRINKVRNTEIRADLYAECMRERVDKMKIR